VHRFGLVDYLARDRFGRPTRLLCSPYTEAPLLLTNDYSGNSAFPYRAFPITGDGRVSFSPVNVSTVLSTHRFPYGIDVLPDELP